MSPALQRRPARDGRGGEAVRATASRARRLVHALLVGVGTGVAVVGVAVLVRDQWPPLVRLDERAVAEGTSVTIANPGLLRTLLAWQWIFLPARLVVPVAALCVLYGWRTRRTQRMWWALATILAAWGLSNAIKEVVRRARPVLDQPVEVAGGFSFPSGHATNTAAMTTALVVLVWPSLGSRALRVAAVGGAATLTLLTAADRVLLGVHFPSDVVAGMLFGTGFVVASYLGFQHWSSPRDVEGTVEGKVA
jgi:undecaprenyl-diphosphatase